MRRLVLTCALSLVSASGSAHADPRAAARALGATRVVYAPDAAAARHISGFTTAPVAGAPAEVALRFATEHAELLGLPAGAQLAAAKGVTFDGADYVRLRLTAGGLPVDGGEAVVRVAGGRVTMVNNGLPDAWTEAALDDVIGRDAAVGIALAAVPGTLRGPATAELVAVPVGRRLRAAWRVDLPTRAPLGLWRVAVDAADGRILRRGDRGHTALGRVFHISPLIPGGFATEDVDLPRLTSTTELDGSYVQVFSGTDASGPMHYAAPDVNGDYLFDPQEPSLTDPFAEVNMYHHVDRVYAFFHDTFAWSHPGGAVYANVNYQEMGMPYANAFAGGGALTFGQADLDFSYDADVVYHEFTHIVVEDTVGLYGLGVDEIGLWMDPQALNEAFADYFSGSLANDPYLGDYIMTSTSTAGLPFSLERRMDGTARCPDSLQGEPHADGIAWSSAGWDVRLALGQTEADRLMYATLVALPSDARFPQAAATAIAQAAMVSPGEEATVTDIMGGRGLSDCRRVIHLGLNGVADQKDGFAFGPGSVQYQIDVPAGAGELRLALEVWGPDPGGTMTYVMDAAMMSLRVRKGQLVGPADPFAGTDYTDDLAGAINKDVTLRTDAPDPPHQLEPGATYYVLVADEDLAGGYYRINASTDLPPPDAAPADAGPPADAAPPADAPVDPETGDGGGCGCRVDGRAPAVSRLTCLFLLALLRLGSRRRRS